MSKQATEFQKKEMSKMYRGKEIFKPLNTGWIDEHVACVREWVANIFFYRKSETTIMIDAGYNYDHLEEKMGWLGIDPKSIRHILITHQDTDHVGAVEADSPGLFRDAMLYIGEIENKYLTGEVRRKVIYHLYKLPQVTINNEKVLLHDGEVFEIDGIKIECFLVPGHTWGHMVYLIDDRYLFTGDTIWFGADGGLQLHFRAGGEQQARCQVAGGVGAEASHARPAARHPDGPHRLDGRSLLRLCAPRQALLAVQEESARPVRAVRRLRRVGRHRGECEVRLFAAGAEDLMRSGGEAGKPASLRGFGE